VLEDELLHGLTQRRTHRKKLSSLAPVDKDIWTSRFGSDADPSTHFQPVLHTIATTHPAMLSVVISPHGIDDYDRLCVCCTDLVFFHSRFQC
jgi:hypothetical protein